MKVKYNRLDEIFKERGWTKYRASKELDISEQMLGSYCSQKHQPTLKKLYTIAKKLGIDPKEILV